MVIPNHTQVVNILILQHTLSVTKCYYWSNCERRPVPLLQFKTMRSLVYCHGGIISAMMMMMWSSSSANVYFLFRCGCITYGRNSVTHEEFQFHQWTITILSGSIFISSHLQFNCVVLCHCQLLYYCLNFHFHRKQWLRESSLNNILREIIKFWEEKLIAY